MCGNWKIKDRKKRPTESEANAGQVQNASGIGGYYKSKRHLGTAANNVQKHLTIFCPVTQKAQKRSQFKCPTQTSVYEQCACDMLPCGSTSKSCGVTPYSTLQRELLVHEITQCLELKQDIDCVLLHTSIWVGQLKKEGKPARAPLPAREERESDKLRKKKKREKIQRTRQRQLVVRLHALPAPSNHKESFFDSVKRTHIWQPALVPKRLVKKQTHMQKL